MLYGLLHDDVLRLGLAFLTALVVSLAIGAWLIRFFHRKNVIEDTTQPDHAGLNAIQSQKKNVPTMGGLMILAAIIIAERALVPSERSCNLDRNPGSGRSGRSGFR